MPGSISTKYETFLYPNVIQTLFHLSNTTTTHTWPSHGKQINQNIKSLNVLIVYNSEQIVCDIPLHLLWCKLGLYILKKFHVKNICHKLFSSNSGETHITQIRSIRVVKLLLESTLFLVNVATLFCQLRLILCSCFWKMCNPLKKPVFQKAHI